MHGVLAERGVLLQAGGLGGGNGLHFSGVGQEGVDAWGRRSFSGKGLVSDG